MSANEGGAGEVQHPFCYAIICKIKKLYILKTNKIVISLPEWLIRSQNVLIRITAWS